MDGNIIIIPTQADVLVYHSNIPSKYKPRIIHKHTHTPTPHTHTHTHTHARTHAHTRARTRTHIIILTQADVLDYLSNISSKYKPRFINKKCHAVETAVKSDRKIPK